MKRWMRLLIVIAGIFLTTACTNTTNTPVTSTPTLSPNPFPTLENIVLPTPLTFEENGTQVDNGSSLPESSDPVATAIYEIDRDICAEAKERRAEVEQLIAQGEDMAEIKSALDELIGEIENCEID